MNAQTFLIIDVWHMDSLQEKNEHLSLTERKKVPSFTLLVLTDL